MEVIEIATYIGLVVIAVLLILIGVLLYKLRRRHKEVRKPTEVKTMEVKTEEGKKRKKLFSGILTKRRKSIEAKQYGIWK